MKLLIALAILVIIIVLARYFARVGVKAAQHDMQVAVIPENMGIRMILPKGGKILTFTGLN